MTNAKKVGSMIIDDKTINRALAAKAEGSTYIGLGDPMVDFGEATHFVDEKDSGKDFDIKFVNNSTTKTIKVQFNKLLSGILEGCQALKEGAIDTDLKVSGTPNSVDMLVAYVDKNPIRLLSAKFKVDDEDQLDEPMKYIVENVFGSRDEKQYVPSKAQSANTNNPKVVDLELNKCVLSDKSTIVLGIRPGRSLNLSLVFGAALDTANALNKKFDEAKDTMAVAYVRSKNKA